MKKSKSSKRLLASIVLSFEAFVVFFATLAAFGLKVGDPSINLPDTEWIWGIGLSFAILCILAPGVLRKPWGYYLGWAIQAAMLVSGFWLWGMFLVAGLTTSMWIWALIAGGTIDKARENYHKLMEGREGGEDSSFDKA
ncbi:MAG TPA: DUF4233 domain-containing protein [Aquiluna sp.]